MPVALDGKHDEMHFCATNFTSVTSHKIQPVTFQIDAKKLTLLYHIMPTPTIRNRSEPSIFFHERGTPFFAD